MDFLCFSFQPETSLHRHHTLQQAMFRTVGALCKKAGAEDFTSTTRVVQESSSHGVTWLTETVSRLRYSRLSSAQRKALWGYFGGAGLYNGAQTFNNGQQALVQHREQNKASASRSPFATDWEAAYEGCRKDSFAVFWRSLIWPLSIASQVMPSLVLLLNKEDDKSTSQ